MNSLNHVAFIMDGNGRWGKRKAKNRNFGHIKGVEVVKKIVKASINLKIPILTFYVFSSENWRRPKKEINFLFLLIKKYFAKNIKDLIAEGIKINILGELNLLPSEIRLLLKKSISLSKNNKKIIVNLAINYGARNEILRASKNNRSKLDIKSFEKKLYTINQPDPDILIRTGGYQRLSNFMLWQLAYTELFFIKKLWPDFNQNDLKKIIEKFKKIKRNFGNL